uniref:ankycorbin n=1 Tax=Myxine glutinosa TaxID=7769 RepID=UPI00358E91FB
MKSLKAKFKRTDWTEWTKNDERLLRAVELGSVERTLSILGKRNVTASKLDSDGTSALHLAASLGKVDCLDVMLSHGADVTATDTSGQTPLHLAAKNKRTDCVHKLLQHKCPVDKADHTGKTSLHYAALCGCFQSVLLLCDHKSSLDAIDEDGQTPLLLAVKACHVDICNLLLALGADMNISDLQQRSPLMLACQAGALAVVATLLERGADSHTSDTSGHGVAEYASQSGNDAILLLLHKAPTQQGSGSTDHSDNKGSCISTECGVCEHEETIQMLQTANEMLKSQVERLQCKEQSSKQDLKANIAQELGNTKDSNDRVNMEEKSCDAKQAYDRVDTDVPSNKNRRPLLRSPAVSEPCIVDTASKMGSCDIGLAGLHENHSAVAEGSVTKAVCFTESQLVQDTGDVPVGATCFSGIVSNRNGRECSHVDTPIRERSDVPIAIISDNAEKSEQTARLHGDKNKIECLERADESLCAHRGRNCELCEAEQLILQNVKVDSKNQEVSSRYSKVIACLKDKVEAYEQTLQHICCLLPESSDGTLLHRKEESISKDRINAVHALKVELDSLKQDLMETQRLYKEMCHELDHLKQVSKAGQQEKCQLQETVRTIEQEKTLLRQRSLKAQDSVQELLKIKTDNYNILQSRDREVEDLQCEMSRLRGAMHSLSQLASHSTGTRKSLQADTLQRQLIVTQQKLVDMEERNRHVVLNYRKHLLCAVKGEMDADVQEALLQILKMNRG